MDDAVPVQSPISLVTTPSDYDLAATLRQRLDEAAAPVVEILKEAEKPPYKFDVSLRIGRDANGALIFIWLLSKDF